MRQMLHILQRELQAFVIWIVSRLGNGGALPAARARLISSTSPEPLRATAPQLTLRRLYAHGVELSLNRTLTRRRQPAWTELVALAARVGYGAVDMTVDEAMPDGVEATVQLLSDHGLRVGGVPLPVDCGADGPPFEEQLRRLPEAASFTAGVGASAMCACLPASSDVPRERLEPLLRRRLGECAAVLADHGLQLGLEFLGPLHMRTWGAHEFLWRLPDTVQFASSCGPNVGILLDSWHWHLSGGTVADVLDAAPLVVHVQLADAPDLPPEEVWDGERLLPGEGVADLVGFLGTLLRAGYAGSVSPEIFGRGLDDLDPESGARLGYESTSATVAEALGQLQP
jgi:sugar phosphate isomerase/epimerase